MQEGLVLSPYNLNVVQKFSHRPHNQGKGENSWVFRGELRPSVYNRQDFKSVGEKKSRPLKHCGVHCIL